MLNYDAMVTRQRKWMLFSLAVFLLGSVFTPYTRVFNGLLLGSVASFYNLWLLQRKTEQFGETVAKGGTSSKLGIGTFARMAAAALVTLIALRFEEHFHIIAVVAGLATSYIFMMLDMFYQVLIKHEKGKHNN
ncbi:ATP synthase subunit I [Virgibacillus ainsalahensis]